MIVVAMAAPRTAIHIRRGSSTTRAATVSTGAPSAMVTYVISRGRRLVCRSITVRATRPAANTQNAAEVTFDSKRRCIATNSTAVPISINTHSTPMAAPHTRQRPRRNSHENTGTSSMGVSW